MDSIVVKIPKPDAGEEADVHETSGTGDKIQSPDIAPGGDIKGDVNIRYGNETQKK